MKGANDWRFDLERETMQRRENGERPALREILESGRV